MNVFITNFRRIIRTEEPEKTLGKRLARNSVLLQRKPRRSIRTFALASYTHTHYLKKVKSVPSGSMLSSMFSLSSSSQNNTEKQITSQKCRSSIDCRHFNFDLVGKKIPSASLFYRLIRCKRFNGNQGIARIASIVSVGFHHGKLFSSDRVDSSDGDDYLETSLYGANHIIIQVEEKA